jgi:hypothetical protein
MVPPPVRRRIGAEIAVNIDGPLRFADVVRDLFHREATTVTRNNILYLIIGVLAVGVGILGYQVYQDRKQPEGMQINVGPNGLSIEKK